jgi:DNA-binding MarR family transcriptional regulator
MLNQSVGAHQTTQAPVSSNKRVNDADSAPAAVTNRPHYLYNHQETLDQFRARQAHAYAAGRRAWRERLIKAQLLPFYEALVGYVGQNQYAWVKEQTLADEFEVHVATIKRWLAKLEDAGLIRRQRRFATSSLTFIVVYDDTEDQAKNTDNQINTPIQENVVKEDYRQNQQAVDDGRNAPTLSAKMHHDSIKDEHLTLVGGRESDNKQSLLPEVQRVLAREGVMHYVLAPTIQQKPFVELQAISGYLSRQRNVRDRPRLFAWLATRNFGAQLLHGRRHRSRQDTCVSIQAAVAPQSNHVNPSIGEHVSASGATSTSVTTNQTLWQSVLMTIQHDIAPAEFATWLADTVLLDVDHQRQIVVVGTPNVFARDVVQQQYSAVLAPELAHRLHLAYTVQVVVDSG